MRARITDIVVAKKSDALDVVVVQARGSTHTAYLDLSKLTKQRFSVGQRISLVFGVPGSGIVYLDGV